MHDFTQNGIKPSPPYPFSSQHQDTDQESQAEPGVGGSHHPAGSSSRGDSHFETQVTVSFLLK